MSQTSDNNRRIAKNTALLYIRSLFGLFVSLYTSRVILNVLGVENYGIYNVVGGMVAMFSLLSNSLSAAVSRYITFELGRGDFQRLRVAFSSSVIIQMGMAILIVILSETIGVWYLNEYINLPDGRLEAAHWVLQFSIISFVIGLISVPYNAAIIAHERMSIFAYISILEQVAKLLVAYLLYISPFDKLIVYAFLLVIVSAIIRMVYGVYCKRNFEECNGKLVFNKSVIRGMSSFAGWNFLGASSTVLITQGVNMLMNLFFSVVVNAARGIAAQIEGVVMGFVYNFTTAINPQITKSYASGERDYMFKLVYKGSKYSFFLVLLFALPICLETETILSLWLGNVPTLTAEFVRLTFLVSLLSVVSNTLVTVMLATGNIKKYQIVVGGTGMLVFPLVYIAYSMGMPPMASYIVTFVVYCVQLLYRLFLLRKMVQLSIRKFIKHVICRDLVVLLFAVPLPCLMHGYLHLDYSFLELLIITIISVVATMLSIFFFGCDKQEKGWVMNKLSNLKQNVLFIRH